MHQSLQINKRNGWQLLCTKCKQISLAGPESGLPSPRTPKLQSPGNPVRDTLSGSTANRNVRSERTRMSGKPSSALLSGKIYLFALGRDSRRVKKKNSWQRWVIAFAGWVCILLFSCKAFAQTAHFSQFYASPLALNPALTGTIPEDIRISTIYRNQWTGIASPFETFALGVDASLRPKFLKNNSLGAGIFLMNDELVENIIHEQWVGVSLAWHHALDVHRRHMVALGVQAAMRSTTIDEQNLIFASQYENFVYNPDLPSGETLLHRNLSNQLFNIGVAWDFRVNEQLRLRSGFSVYDMLKNKESIFEEGVRTAHRRFGWHGGAVVKINERFSVHPEVLYLNQSRAEDINVGGYVGYQVGSQRNVVLYAGPWFRWKDAMIWMGGIGYKNLTLRASYDMTVSRLTQVTEAENVSGNSVGAYELSMVWKLRLSRATKSVYTIPCGIF